MNIQIEFGGGVEMLFDKQKSLRVPVTEERQWTIEDMIGHLSEKYIKERVELFATDGKIRPGILVLVNDVDYEILGGHSYVIKPDDKVTFISTLHGG